MICIFNSNFTEKEEQGHLFYTISYHYSLKKEKKGLGRKG